MRVATRELKAARQGDTLVRYALLGPVAFVHVEMPNGSTGTNLEKPCQQEHWGLTLQGTLQLHGARDEALAAGTAWHTPPGRNHRFTTLGRVVLAGFVPVDSPVDDSASALGARGLRPVTRVAAPRLLPADFQLPGAKPSTQGDIQVASVAMGPWLCTRANFGPLSGYTSGWCDLTHWGLVLRGDLVIRYEDDVELLGPGDIYYCPPGPPGHQFEVADFASIIDYTPVDVLARTARRAGWRIVAARPWLAEDAEPVGAAGHDEGGWRPDRGPDGQALPRGRGVRAPRKSAVVASTA